MHHRSDVDKHGLIILRDGASDHTLLYDDSMAKNKVVQVSSSEFHGVCKLLFDSLRLS